MSFFGKTTSGGLANISLDGAIKTGLGVYSYAGTATTPSGTGRVVLATINSSDFSGFFQVMVTGQKFSEGRKYLYSYGSWIPNKTSPEIDIQDTNVPNNNWRTVVEEVSGIASVVFYSSSGGDTIFWNVTLFPTYDVNGNPPL